MLQNMRVLHMLRVRRFKSGDEDSLRLICRDTTLNVNALEYGAELAGKWAARLEDRTRWANRIRKMHPFVAEMNNEVVGFAELTPTGEISAFYSHHKCQGSGVGSVLFEAIEAEAFRLQLDCLKVESSLSASGFFARKGFNIVEEKVRLTEGVPSKSVAMEKKLSVE